MSETSDTEFLVALADARPTIDGIVDFVNSHPELGHEEVECSAHLMGVLREAGFEVTAGVGGMPTAFRAEIAGGLPGRTVGVVALYDAPASLRADGVVDPIHSCGHGPQSAGVVGAALAFAAGRQSHAGRFVVVGCPADEIHSPLTRSIGGGKGVSAAQGVWDDIDVALYPHPEFIDTVWTKTLWMRRETALVVGERTLSRDGVSTPVAALAALATITEQTDPAQIIIERVVFDGDVEEGSGAVLEATFLSYSETEEGLETQMEPVRRLLGPAAWTQAGIVPAVRPDAAVTALVADAFAAAGRGFDADPPALPFPTDFGHVSRRVPSALVGIGRAEGWGYHTPLGAVQFAGPEGREIAEATARVIGLSVLRLGPPVAAS
ncbi:MAG: M20/M25/M40 family metallo-hydrolase [Herbiconiux sp.]|uniref:M20/M25/M40 family metallo-hydrolase n=1 Tax=Herbiconiux sp. TaxID=1871186 RepID=UPI00121305B6|nr:M20/M25/M40 family metallo-hydrolase [Herbiconiux sp.]TAJ49419.1 MAG: M20/M25/M40 family metallo-hydrolase [Herbiconiux sp.]